VIVEAPDDEAVAKIALAVLSRPHVKQVTLNRSASFYPANR
jgi:uncharacterized protein with GYD domain